MRELRSGFTKNLPFGIIIAVVLLAEIVLAMSAWRAGPALSGAGSARDRREPQHRGVGAGALQPFPLPFEIAGLILLVAMIGAIVLTHRSRGDVRGQKISRQVDRRPEEAIETRKSGSGRGDEAVIRLPTS